MNRTAWLGSLLMLTASLSSGTVRAEETPPTASTTARKSPPPGFVFMTGAQRIAPADYTALPKTDTFRAWLPKAVDLTPNYPKPGYQGPQPSCVAWATTYAARSFLNGRALGRQPTDPSEQMSPAYVYNRLRAPGTECTTTMSIVNALNLLKREGAVTLADFPDDIKSCHIPAPAALLGKAATYRLGDWRAIERERPNDERSPVVIDDIKGALSRGEPIVFAMPVAQDWYNLAGDTVYTHAGPAGDLYHAMAVVGYSEDRQAFRIINSWGDWWADNGYAWIGYSTFKALVNEAYALQAPPHTDAAKPAEPALRPRAAFDLLAAKLPCGAVTVSGDDKALAVTGFGGSAEAIEALHTAALAMGGKVDWQVAHHPWPQCEAELTLARALAAGGVTLASAREGGDPRSGDPVRMKAGEIFGITATVDAGRPYLSIVYLQADGSAVELYRGTPDEVRGSRRSVTIGLQGAKETRFQVGPPYGDELLIALASDHPIADDFATDYHTERQFLTGLRARLAQMPVGEVTAAVLRLRTEP
ncbi:MAG: C1 family peptidase [Novosphingobium sp.]